MSYSFIAPPKDPHAAIDYSMDWSAWLADGDSIASQTVVADDDTLSISQANRNGAAVEWRASAGTAGHDCLVTVSIVTANGQSDQRTVKLPIKNR